MDNSLNGLIDFVIMIIYAFHIIDCIIAMLEFKSIYVLSLWLHQSKALSARYHNNVDTDGMKRKPIGLSAHTNEGRQL